MDRFFKAHSDEVAEYFGKIIRSMRNLENIAKEIIDEHELSLVEKEEK